MDFDELRRMIGDEEFEQAARTMEGMDPDRLTAAQADTVVACLSALPEGARRARPRTIYLLMALSCARGDRETFHRCHQELGALRDAAAGNTRRWTQLCDYVYCGALMRPEADNASMLMTLAIMRNDLSESPGLRPETLSATGGRPSVLRGNRDLSEWGRNCRAVAQIVGPMLPVVLRERGGGVCEAAIAELLYERNDLGGASLELAGAISASDPEIAFAGLALLARIGLLDPGGKDPLEVCGRIERMIAERGAEGLEPFYRALRARIDILAGRLDAVDAWLRGSGAEELGACRPRDDYELMTKAQAYLALGRAQEAMLLLENLLRYCREYGRVLDAAECLAHGAVACAMAGMEERALDKLAQALAAAEPYGYIRVIADRGKPVFDLLLRLARSEGASCVKEKYLRAVTEAARDAAVALPGLYRQRPAPQEAGVELTQTELGILALLEQGMTNRDIGEQMHIKLSTVKFHMANVFGKLGTDNRTAAVSEAKRLGLLP